MDRTPKPVDHPSASQYAEKLSASIKGKTVLVTGASPKSLGGVFLTAIAPHGPKLLILAGRSPTKLQQTATEIAAVAPTVPTRIVLLNLSSLAAVRTAAAEINSWTDVPAIDVLVLNAGIMAQPYHRTDDGFEGQFGVNHLAQFLFANLILPKALAAPDGGRVVVVSSDGHAASPLRKTKQDIMFDNGASYDIWLAYGQSKSANVLFAHELATKLGPRGLQAYSLHPGAISETGLGGHVPPEEWHHFMQITDKVRDTVGEERRKRSTNIHTAYTDFSQGFKFKSLEDGAATYVPAAFDPSLKPHNGGYLQNGKLDPEGVESWATDPAEAARLWSVSEDFVGHNTPY